MYNGSFDNAEIKLGGYEGILYYYLHFLKFGSSCIELLVSVRVSQNTRRGVDFMGLFLVTPIHFKILLSISA